MAEHRRAKCITAMLVVALAVVALTTSACDEGDGDTRLIPTDTPGPPTPEPLSLPAWVPGDPDQGRFPQGFVIEVDTGLIWELTTAFEPAISGDQVAFLTWSPQGEALVSVVRRDSGSEVARSSTYIGAPGAPFRELFDIPARRAAYSPEGELVAIEAVGIGTLIVEPETGEVIAELSEQADRVLGWSADSRYVALKTTTEEGRVLIWDIETGSATEIGAQTGVWSNSGARFAYWPGPRSQDPSPMEVRIRDFGTDIDTRALTVTAYSATPLDWSADDRFLAVAVGVWPDELRIIDTTGSAPQVAVSGVLNFAPATWIDDTLVFVGNLCGNYDIFTVDAEGNSLRNYTKSPGVRFGLQVSPDSKRVAFTDAEARGGQFIGRIRQLFFSTGQTEDLVSSTRGLVIGEWSPDGRYLTFSESPGVSPCANEPPQTTTVKILP